MKMRELNKDFFFLDSLQEIANLKIAELGEYLGSVLCNGAYELWRIGDVHYYVPFVFGPTLKRWSENHE